MSKSERVKSDSAAAAAATATAIRVGVDLGTNTTVLAGAWDGKRVALTNDIFKSVVGFPKEGIIPGILPNDKEVLIGDEAIDYRLHLDLSWVLHHGCVADVETAQLFTRHCRTILDAEGAHHIWGVVGAPANSSPEQEKDLRSAMAGVLDRLVVVPEPFLAAMGLRDDANYKDSGDPTKHSLIVDIGAGTTDLCLVRGYFPTADDQISFPRAGNFIDDKLFEGVERRYPDIKLTRVTLTQMKESHSFVSGFERDADVKVYVDGRPRVVDFSEIVRDACEEIIPDILKGVKELLRRCDSDSIEHVMANIILTGGGSQIHGLCERVQEMLREDGYDSATTVRPADYKRLVANGALKIAENVRDDQWQVPM